MPAPSRKQSLFEVTNSSAPVVRLRVLLPLPLADAYDYRTEGVPPPPGSFVAVPLGGRQVIGVVWDEAPDSDLPEHRLRPIAAVLDAPPMPEKLRRFVDWVAAYTLSPRGAVLRMAMSVPAALEAQPHRAGWCRADPLPEAPRLTPSRQRVLAALTAREVRAPDDLAREAGVAPAVLRGMADAGLLALIACLGLAQLSHEATPALAQAAFTAVLLYGLAATPPRRWQPRLAVALGLLGLALSGAPSPA